MGVGHPDLSGTGLDRVLGSFAASGVTRVLEERRPGHPLRAYGAAAGVGFVAEARCSTPTSLGQGRVVSNSEGYPVSPGHSDQAASRPSPHFSRFHA